MRKIVVVMFVVAGLACGSSATEPGSKGNRVPFAQLFDSRDASHRSDPCRSAGPGCRPA